MFSLELIENIIRVQYQAFDSSIALASNTAVERGAFSYCWDLLHIFGMIEALRMPYEIDLLSFQFIARCTTNLTTIK
jgi:hypothetical protein